MTPMIMEALAVAAEAHKDQQRKYTGEPYINHPINVARLVLKFSPHASEEVIAAALLHDVVEDTAVTVCDLKREFGDVVARLVDDLTERKQAYIQLNQNRAQRKEQELQRLKLCNSDVQNIKVADLIDNTSTIAAHDPDFAKVYLKEKADLLENLTRADERLLETAWLVHEMAEQMLHVTTKGNSGG